MSFPRYPEYKDSGVEWLGEVPDHWEVTALKRVVNPERQITYGIVQAGPHVPDGIPYIRPADMRDEQGVVAPDDVMRTSPEIASGYSRSTIREGDLVCSIGPSFGKVMVTPQWLDGANLTQGTARIAVHLPHDARYLFWTLRSPFSIAQWESSVGGATFRALNLAPLAETTILVPAVAEQTQIAVFLDRETAKIDELVAEQRRLMELLKEKRQAVISHAVTQGLNPHAPMKPSGIEWLGDVPAHWEVVSLKRFCDVRDGTHDTPQFIDTSDVSFPFVTSKDLVNGQVCLDETKHVSATDYHEISRRSGVARGDVLMPMIGSIGGAVLVETDVHFAIKNIALFKASTNYNSRWLQLMLDSDLSVLQFELNRSGGVQGFVALGTLRNLSFPFPSLDEQDKIVSFLAIESAKFDTLTAEAQRAIDLLQERRTALISAAVTGQIDVCRHSREGGNPVDESISA